MVVSIKVQPFNHELLAQDDFNSMQGLEDKQQHLVV